MCVPVLLRYSLISCSESLLRGHPYPREHRENKVTAKLIKGFLYQEITIFYYIFGVS